MLFSDHNGSFQGGSLELLHWPANRSFANGMTAERAAEAKMLQG